MMSWGKVADILVEAFLSVTLISALLYVINWRNGLDQYLVYLIEIVMIMTGIVITVRAFKNDFDYGVFFGIILAVLSFGSLLGSAGPLIQILIAGAFLGVTRILFPDLFKGIFRSILVPFKDIY